MTVQTYSDRERLRNYLRQLQAEVANPDTPSFRKRELKERIYQIAETLVGREAVPA